MLKNNVLKVLMTAIILTGIAITGTAQQGLQLQQQQSSSEVSDKELKKFAGAMQQTQQVQQEYQQEMVDGISETGLEVQRFNELAQASQDPNAEVNASDQEMKQFNKAVEIVQKKQAEMQEEAQKAIDDSGLEPQRYQEIMAMVQQDQELQQRLQNMMQ